MATNKGYEQEAQALLKQYEAVNPEVVHAGYLSLLPMKPSIVLDVGAGSGRDAAYFADQGHRVVAVEPTKSLRLGAQNIHAGKDIEWIDDLLPDLSQVKVLGLRFDLIMLSAVLMHLDEEQRVKTLATLASLLSPDGRIVMSLRHGPVPEGRQMFDIGREEILRLAEENGLRAHPDVPSDKLADPLGRSGVSWSKYVLEHL